VSAKPCRNCGSPEQYVNEVVVGGSICHMLLPIGPGFFGKGAKAAFEIHVCGSCGVTDWFVPKRLLPEVQAKFSRVP
jgi:hypothetical protein